MIRAKGLGPPVGEVPGAIGAGARGRWGLWPAESRRGARWLRGRFEYEHRGRKSAEQGGESASVSTPW